MKRNNLFRFIVLATLASAALVSVTPSYSSSAPTANGLEGSLENLTGSSSGALGAHGISADGRYVVLGSTASDFTPNDTNERADIFLVDTVSGEVINITETFDGDSFEPDISADGSTVVFVSDATNVTDGLNPGFFSLFVYEVRTGSFSYLYASERDFGDLSVDGRGVFVAASVDDQIWRVDLDSPSASDQITLGRDQSGAHAQISDHGHHVVFTSTSSSFEGAPADGHAGVFLWSKSAAGERTEALTANASASSWLPSVNADGSRVVFGSRAWNLVPGDLNENDDIFLWRAGEGLENLTESADSWSATGTISADGRRVAFSTSATNLASNVDGSPGDRNSVLVWDEAEGSYTNITPDGDSDSRAATISADGNSVAFFSSATNLTPDDNNGAPDTLLWRDSNPVPWVDPYDYTVELTQDLPMSLATTFEEFVNAYDFDPVVHGEILRLYPAFFNRQPDLEGARYWVLEVYGRGQTISQITAYFSDPQQTEFVNFYDDIDPADNEGYLARVYNNMLGRQPDADGFAYWLGLMDSGELDRGSVVRWVALNEEFIHLNNYGR